MDDRAQKLHKLHPVGGAHAFLCLDAAQRQQVLDQALHAAGLDLHRAEKPLGRGGVVPGRSAQRFDKAQKRRQRRAQLVADIGDEIAPHLPRLFQMGDVFETDQHARARRLIERLSAEGLSKYNLNGSAPDLTTLPDGKRILVTGGAGLDPQLAHVQGFGRWQENQRMLSVSQRLVGFAKILQDRGLGIHLMRSEQYVSLIALDREIRAKREERARKARSETVLSECM